MAFSYAKLVYPGTASQAPAELLGMIDTALVAAGWTRVNGYNYVSLAAYSGGVPTGAIADLAASDKRYVSVGYTCTDSLASSQPFHLLFDLRTGTTAGTNWELGIAIGDNGTGGPPHGFTDAGLSTFDFRTAAFSGRVLGVQSPSIGNTVLTNSYISAYESGFTLLLTTGAGSTIYSICIERCRDYGGAILKDVVALAAPTALGFSVTRPADAAAYATPTGHTTGSCYVLTSSGGTFTETALGTAISLHNINGTASYSGSDYLQASPSIAADTIVLTGPYMRSNSRELYGRPRTMALSGAGTFSSLGSNANVVQDGVTRVFRVPESETTLIGQQKILLATQ